MNKQSTTSQADRQRVIKFRGLSSDSGQVCCYGFYTEENGVGYIRNEKGFVIRVDRNTVGQFTGLLDKNGNEIYEGDLISDGQHVWLVVFIEGCFWLKRDGYRTTNSMYSWPDNCYPMFRVNHAMYSNVIGNVYANSNLLQG